MKSSRNILKSLAAGLTAVGFGFPLPKFSFGSAEVLDAVADTVTDLPGASFLPDLPIPIEGLYHVSSEATEGHSHEDEVNELKYWSFLVAILDRIQDGLPPCPYDAPPDTTNPTVSIAEAAAATVLRRQDDVLSVADASDGMVVHHVDCVTRTEILRDWPKWEKQWYDLSVTRVDTTAKWSPRSWELLVERKIGATDEFGHTEGAWMAYDSESLHDEYKYYLNYDYDVEDDSDTSSGAKSESNGSINDTGTSDGNISEHFDDIEYGKNRKRGDMGKEKETWIQVDYPVSRLRVPRDDNNTFMIENNVKLARDKWIRLKNPKPDSQPCRANVPLLTLTTSENMTYFLDDPVEYNIPDGPYMDFLIERRQDQINQILCLSKQAGKVARYQ